jgi:CRP/FNR family transcriptional regulator
MEYRASCTICRLASICLPIALEASEVNRLDSIIERSKPLHKGEYAFREGQPFTSVFALRSGALKAFAITGDGKEQVTGFYFPGELFGVDGIAQNRHVISVKALETSAVCEIPFAQLESLSATLPSLQRHVFRLMSREITQDQQLITLLSRNSAERRVAALLINLSQRNAKLQRSATAFRLPMSRTDIGNYLGLTVETVSRIFSRFQKSRLLAVEKKEIRLLDVPALEALASD